jgi:hypothetical protein
MPEIIALQFAAKVVGGVVWSFIIKKLWCAHAVAQKTSKF